MNTKNNLHVLMLPETQIVIQSQNITSNTVYFSTNASSKIFVDSSNQVYVDFELSGRFGVYKYLKNRSIPQVALNTTSPCYSFALNTQGDVYCSISTQNQVIKRSVNDDPHIISVVAGNASVGSLPHQLSQPLGIFIERDNTLYVADCGNNRIQNFSYGKLNGTTVAKNLTIGEFTMNCPTELIIDQYRTLYVIDSNNFRILALAEHSVRCIIGCFNRSSSSIGYFQPIALTFDTRGNLLIADNYTGTVEKFLLLKNCSIFI